MSAPRVVYQPGGAADALMPTGPAVGAFRHQRALSADGALPARRAKIKSHHRVTITFPFLRSITMSRNDLDPIMAALATAFLLGPTSGLAADPATKDPPAAAGAQREATPMTPGAQSEATSTIPGMPPTPATDERTQLKQALQVGEDKAFYRQTLESEGYKITSVNSEKPDYVEYEVVKGTASYEIQIALNESTGRAEKVDVTPNLWRAKETKQEIRRSAPPPTPATTAPAPITSGDKK